MSAPESSDLVTRRLTLADLAAVVALHQRVRATLPRDLIAYETDDFFADHMDRLGRIYGCFWGKDLVAYAVLGLPRHGDANFGTDHGLAGEELGRVAHLDGAAVLEPWQGQGLHRAMTALRMEAAWRHGRSIMLSTAAPLNIPSLCNLLLCGLRIRGLVQKFGGARFLLRRDVEEADSLAPRECFPDYPAADRVALADLDGHHEALRRGLSGVALDGEATSLHVVWAET